MRKLPPIDLTRPEVGDFYDELPLWSAPFGQMLLERVPVGPGLSVLDVGAGTGFLTIELAQRLGAAAVVYAVDPWAAAVARLRRKVHHLGLANVRVLEQDAAAIDLPAASIDVVVSNLGINNFDNTVAVLRECLRLLKPGASLLLTTNLVGTMQEFYDVYRATLVELALTDRLPALDAHVQHRATVESTTRLLQDAGFVELSATTGSFRMRYADGSALLNHYFIRLGFLPAWQAIVAPADRARTFAALERNLDALAAERGELALTIPTALFMGRRAQSAGSRFPTDT